MSAQPFYRAVYHRNDWTLADAFRLQPGWGSLAFTVPSHVLEGVLGDDLIQMAKESAPEGHRLTSLSLLPVGQDERVIWSTSPDLRLADTTIPKDTQ